MSKVTYSGYAISRPSGADFREHPIRDCPKSPGDARNMARGGSGGPEGAPFGPFGLGISAIHARSIARTPFRTVSERSRVNKGAAREVEMSGWLTNSS